MTSSFIALPKESTAELLAERIRDAILTGKLSPGERLVEQDLAKQFAISRGPVREAIRILGTENLVELRKNCGAMVSIPTLDDVLEVYAIRMSLGSIAIDHLARTVVTRKISLGTLEPLLTKIATPNKRRKKMSEINADLHFQNSLIALSGLSRITDAIVKTGIDLQFFVRALEITYSEVDLGNLVKRHYELIDCIKRGDANLAIDHWQAHIKKSVGDFTADKSPEEMELQFERPLMSQVIHSARQRLN